MSVARNESMHEYLCLGECLVVTSNNCLNCINRTNARKGDANTCARTSEMWIVFTLCSSVMTVYHRWFIREWVENKSLYPDNTCALCWDCDHRSTHNCILNIHWKVLKFTQLLHFSKETDDKVCSKCTYLFVHTPAEEDHTNIVKKLQQNNEVIY